MKFEGKISRWWYVVTIILNVFAVIFMITKMNVNSAALFIPPLILLDLYLVPVMIKNHVTVDRKEVVIQFGFFRKTIETQNITSVKETKSMASSFCASSYRVAIESKGFQTIYVALTDNKAFIKKLISLNKKVRYTIG